MPENSLLSLLHVSDFHSSKRKSRDQEIVVDALVHDLEGLCIGHRRPDLILFTGDLVHAAGVDSHLNAYDAFLTKIAAATGCGEERIFMAPGNHDAMQAFVKEKEEEHREWREKANDMGHINAMYEGSVFDGVSDEKFKEFYELEQYLGVGNLRYRNSFVSVFIIDSIKTCIVVLNTAQLSSAGFRLLGDDAGKLTVPEYAVRDALKILTPSYFTIFATHHPLALLSQSGEKFLRSVIQKHADMHLFGHMHDPQTSSTIGFEGNVYSNQAGAIFTARRGYYIGYSLISVDLDTKHSETHLRTYFDDRTAFDEAIDVVQGGRFYSSQAAREFWRGIAAPIDDQAFRRHLAKECYCVIQEETEHAGERNTHEMFVSPPMTKRFLEPPSGQEEVATVERNVEFDELVFGDDNVILYALSEHGRTTVLRELQHRLLCDAETIGFPRLPLLIDFEDIRHNVSGLIRAVKAQAPCPSGAFDVGALLKLGHICLMFDDVAFADVRRMEILREFVSMYPKVRYIFSCLKNVATPLGARAVPEMPIHFDFIELCALKRRQMRQLIANYNSGHDVDIILDRIQSEIEEINLPFTAANGSILMVIYDEQSGFKTINRSVLIEQFVDVTLTKGSVEQSQRETFDYRNKTSLLAHLAAWMSTNNKYTVELEDARDVIRSYIDRLGLVVDVGGLIDEFFACRLFVRKPVNRLCFRYRAVLEYFISLEMFNNQEFMEWVLDESRYLSFMNEIQYFAGKRRKDTALIEKIGERFCAFIDMMEADIGKIDLHRISGLKLPNEDGKSSTIDHLSAQLSAEPLTQEEKDAELEADLPRDVEHRQEVFRPEIKNPGQKLFVSLLLYSGVLKNLEHIDDADKRRHLNNIWKGWGIFLHLSLQVAAEIAIHRRIRIDGVLYEVVAPHGISNEALTRLIALNLPMGVSRLIAANLGTEKLERQLTEPKFDDVDSPLVFEFFRTALISDLRLPASETVLGAALSTLQPSRYLTEAMIWKIADLRRYERLPKEKFNKLAPYVATAIAHLKGGKGSERDDEKRKQLDRLRREGILLSMKKARERE